MMRDKDRRRPPRVALFDDFHVLDGQTGELLGYIRDISSHSMMVVGSLMPVVDQAYTISVVLPEPIAEVKTLMLVAACRWHTVDVKRKFHQSGFQFGTLAHPEAHILEQIQIDYEFSNSENKLRRTPRTNFFSSPKSKSLVFFSIHAVDGLTPQAS